jgi:hypothetical protein
VSRTLVVLLAIAAGLVLVLAASAALDTNDEGDVPVSAGEWAQNVCGAVGTWRGEVEAIVDDISVPNARGDVGEEPQSETPQGRTGFVRQGLERLVGSAERLVEGIDRSGVPETSQGEEAAGRLTSWADSALEELEEEEDRLDEEPQTPEEAMQQLTGVLRTIGAVLASGAQTIVEVARLDPELSSALRDASTCRQLREETGS